MPLKLSAAELEDALAHVEAPGASDFFPQPFEIASIRHSWKSVRAVLETLDLEIYQPRPAYTMIAPKHSYTLRPIQLLNPIDALLYVALVCRLAPAIEAKRAGYRNGIVLSNVFNQAQRAPRRPSLLTGTDTERQWTCDWLAAGRWLPLT